MGKVIAPLLKHKIKRNVSPVCVLIEEVSLILLLSPDRSVNTLTRLS